jgi:type VI secretion system protein ImpG
MKNFLNYYQDELLFLREKGKNFGEKHPDIAAKLDVKNAESSDPQTERIIESFAFMAAKINQRIDDNSQSIAFHLLSALYPNLINIFPPCGTVSFTSEDGISSVDNIYVPRNTSLFVKSKEGIDCHFKTLYPVNIYPISIVSIDLFKAPRKVGGIDGWCVELKISSKNSYVENLRISDLLFHINTEIIEDALLIYESIFSSIDKALFLKINNKYIKLDEGSLVPCGFGDEELVCPLPRYANNSFQLLQEMLHFQRKFIFFRILNIDKFIKESGVTEIEEFSILIDINFCNDRLLKILKNESIILNSTPIVNLFPFTSDPFRFDGTQTKYLLIADQTRDKSLEIHSISGVHIIDTETKEDRVIQPYFSLELDSDSNILHDIFWVYTKDSAESRNLEGFDTYISFIDTKMNPHAIYSDVAYATTLCTNRFETREIPVFSKMYVDAIETAGYSAKLLHKVSKPVSFSENSTILWNLVSQLSATHISLEKGENLLL